MSIGNNPADKMPYEQLMAQADVDPGSTLGGTQVALPAPARTPATVPPGTGR